MKRWIKIVLAIAFLCIIVGTMAALFFKSRLPDIIASTLSNHLKTPVHIGTIDWKTRSITVGQFTIDNPPGFYLPQAFSAGQITLNAPLTHYIKDHIIIEEIVVSDVYIGLEFDSIKSTRGNWSTLLAQAQPSSSSTPEKTVFIKRLLLTNIHAELLYQNEKKAQKLKTIPQIELTNISSQGGDVGEQLMNSALGQAVKQIFIEENLKDTFDQLMRSPAGDQLKNYLGPLKNFFNKQQAPLQHIEL